MSLLFRYASNKYIQICNINSIQINNINERNEKNQTALMVAIENNNMNMVNFLLTNNIDINATDNDKLSTLLYAVFFNNHQITEMLLILDANPNIRDSNGNTPLMLTLYPYLVDNTNLKMIKLLISYGADPFLFNNEGKNIYDLIHLYYIHNREICNIENFLWHLLDNKLKEFKKITSHLFKRNYNTYDNIEQITFDYIGNFMDQCSDL